MAVVIWTVEFASDLDNLLAYLVSVHRVKLCNKDKAINSLSLFLLGFL